MRLFIMFRTSSIMFRLELLRCVNRALGLLHSCSHVMTFFVCVMSSSPYKCHTDPLWMKQGDSHTSIYTIWCICKCLFEEDNITHTSCSYTTPHHYGRWELHRSLQTSRIVVLIFSSPNLQAPLSPKFDAQLGLVAKNDFLSIV